MKKQAFPNLSAAVAALESWISGFDASGIDAHAATIDDRDGTATFGPRNEVLREFDTPPLSSGDLSVVLISTRGEARMCGLSSLREVADHLGGA